MKAFLDWSSYKDAGMGDAYADIPKTGGDFAKAVAVCIKSGICESDRPGVMCPSFRVDQDASLSTGARVTLLKKALNGELGELGLLDQALARTMELCVACKGCKRECENNVDMAMIKIEYLAQRFAIEGTALRTKIFGNIGHWMWQYPFLKTIINLHNRIPLIAKLNEMFIGISSKISIPPFQKAFTSPKLSESSVQDKEVVLLIDTFTRNMHPENAYAVIEVLEKAGYRVFITESTDSKKTLCCGRTQMAHGLIKEAKEQAIHMLEVLKPHVDKGRTILGLEPACLLAIRDEYKYLGLGEEAEKASSQAILFEEFIAKEVQAKRFKLDFKAIDKKIMVHGHCHQKAVGAMKSMRKVLRLIPNLDFDFIESSCCGMAGSFGIEKEHVDIARSMAEMSLLPEIRKEPDAEIVANGFSCQHQIKEGTNRESIHIAVLLQRALA